jgi:DNA-binding NarL/FixJ family response regulator
VIQVLLADDQTLVRAGLQMIIDAQEDMAVIGEPADGAEALEVALRCRPDVVLMDIRMPELDGIEATRRLLAEGSTARIVMLTTFYLDEYVYEAMRAGASGFLLKTASPHRSPQLSATRRWARRWSRRLSLAGSWRSSSPGPDPRLTRRRSSPTSRPASWRC